MADVVLWGLDAADKAVSLDMTVACHSINGGQCLF